MNPLSVRAFHCGIADAYMPWCRPTALLQAGREQSNSAAAVHPSTHPKSNLRGALSSRVIAFMCRDARKKAKEDARLKDQREAEAKAAADTAAKAEAEASAAVTAAEAKKARQLERKAMQKERSRLRSLCANSGGFDRAADLEVVQQALPGLCCTGAHRG